MHQTQAHIPLSSPLLTSPHEVLSIHSRPVELLACVSCSFRAAPRPHPVSATLRLQLTDASLGAVVA